MADRASSFSCVLIANRGEVSCRIARSVRRAGLRAVAVFTEADRASPHVEAADEAVFLPDLDGAGEPYLDAARLVDAARAAGAQAVHPGYGFLSENAEFAQACAGAGLVFIGPGVDTIRLMGNKADAKRRLRDAGVPCVPGYDGEDQCDERLRAEATRIGYPVLIKAVAGGGGRGMRRVERADAFAEELRAARSEAKSAFGSDAVILERALERVRHVEVQIAADRYGHVVHLGERDCSSQRRSQKVIEETPSPVVDAAMRAALGSVAARAAAAIGYEGVGTLEFLVDETRAFYFIEMNTRLQVEHAVTEAVTGVDLVDWQLRVAAGQALPLAQHALAFRGAAIEARLYAEDPDKGFIPDSGTIVEWMPPGGDGIRVDHAVRVGMPVGTRYDSMLAKVIAHAPSREAARQRLLAALRALRVGGVLTNKAFLIRCLTHPDFVAGTVHTRSLDAFATMPPRAAEPWQRRIALALAYLHECRLWSADPDDWSSLGPALRSRPIALGDDALDCLVSIRGGVVRVGTRDGELPIGEVVFTGWPLQGGGFPACAEVGEGDASGVGESIRRVRRIAAVATHRGVSVDFGETVLRAEVLAPVDTGGGWRDPVDGAIVAPMAGKVIDVRFGEGESVAAGDIVLVIEAMKMEHRICAPGDGRLVMLRVGIGDQVARADLLAMVETFAPTGAG